MTAQPPVAGDMAGELVGDLGDQVVDASLAIAPVAVPFMLALAAIHWALSKFGVYAAADRRNELLAAQQRHDVREARRAKSAAAKDLAVRDSYAANARGGVFR